MWRQNHYRAAVDTAADAILVVDGDGVIVSANPATSTIFGYESVALVGLPIGSLLERDGSEKTSAAPRDPPAWCRVDGKVGILGRRKDGSAVPIELSSADWSAADGAQYTSLILRDVAAFREAEAALAESQNWLRTVTDTAMAGLLVIDRQQTICFANRAFAVLFGLASHDLAGFKLSEILPTIDKAMLLRSARALAAGRTTEEFALPLSEGRQQVRHLVTTFEASRNASGEQVVVVVATDVTELKRKELELRASRDLLQSVLDGTGDAIFAKDGTGCYVMVNQLAARHIGKSREAIIGNDDLALFSGEKARAHHEEDRAIIESGRSMEVERTLLIEGEQRELIVTKRRWLGPNGDLAGIVGLAHDVTEQRMLARERQQLSKRLTRAQEAERLRIARELHDEVGQNLTGLSLGLKELEDGIDDPKARSSLLWLRDLTDDISAALHRTAHELRPTSLEDFGLRQAISSHVAQWATRFNLHADVALDDLDAVDLDPDAQLALYRGVQEILTNTIKHAQASQISVVAQITPAGLRLIVEDNGIGFDPASIGRGGQDGGLGLLGIRERMSQIGGDMVVESSEGNGSAFFLSTPLVENQISEIRHATRCTG